MCGYPFAPIQILTVDTRKGCAFRCSRLHDDRRSFSRKSCIERRFESSPGVQRFANLGVFLRYFLHAAKSTNPFPCRELRGSANLESAHPNNNFPLTKLNPFAASRLLRRPRRHFLLLPQQLLSLRDFSCGFAAFVTFPWKVVPAGTAHSVCRNLSQKSTFRWTFATG